MRLFYLHPALTKRKSFRVQAGFAKTQHPWRKPMPSTILVNHGPKISPLMLADRLLSLAQDADKAGLQKPAERLLRLAFAVCGEKPAAG
jgi:hypothetical protein